MWTDDHRDTHKPRSGRYPSDISDEEWALIEPMLPPPRTGGRRRVTDMREVFNAIRYVNRTGCQAAAAQGLSSAHNGLPLLLGMVPLRRA